MALFCLVFFVVALILIGVGFAVGVVGCCMAAILVGVGVLSSSVLIALINRRPSAPAFGRSCSSAEFLRALQRAQCVHGSPIPFSHLSAPAGSYCFMARLAAELVASLSHCCSISFLGASADGPQPDCASAHRVPRFPRPDKGAEPPKGFASSCNASWFDVDIG